MRLKSIKSKRKVVPRLTPADIEAKLAENKKYCEAVMAIFDVAPASVKRRAHKYGDDAVRAWYEANPEYVNRLIEEEKQREALNAGDRDE